MKDTVITYLKLSLALLIWSYSYIWTKQSLALVTPITLILFRLVISAFFLFVIAVVMRKLSRLNFKSLRFMLIIAVFEPFLYFLCETYGILLVTPTIAAVMLATVPLFTPFAAYLYLNERIRLVNVIGIFISFFGLLLIIVSTNSTIEYSIIGLLLMFGTVVTAVIYSILCTKMLKTHNSYTIVAYQNGIGALFFLPLFFFIEFPTFDIQVFDINLIRLILLLSFLASTVAFLIYISSIKKIGIVKVNAMLNALPMLTAIISYYLYDEDLPMKKIIGIIVVILGVGLSQSNIRQKKLKGIVNI